MTFSGLPSLRDPKLQHQQQQSQQFQHHVKPSAPATTATPPSTTAAFSIPATTEMSVPAIPSSTHTPTSGLDGSSSSTHVSVSESNSLLDHPPHSHQHFDLTPLALVDPRSALVSSPSQSMQVSEAQAHAQAHAQAQALAQLEASMALTDTSVAQYQQQQQQQPHSPQKLSTPSTSLQSLQLNYQQTSQEESDVSAPSLDLKSTTPIKPGKKTSKKPTVPPAHNSAYRKRLNVNQVCDWCRYRKIRCDRESPCNSCIHSRRECIRSPPQLGATNTSTEKPVTKRGRPAEDKEGRRSSKAYRSSDMSTIRSSDNTSSSFSSPGVESEDESLATLLDTSSPLAGNLNLAALAMKLSLSGPATPSVTDFVAESRLDSQNQTPLVLSSGLVTNTSTDRSLSHEEREHFERMQRIELLLCKMIPGAAEFIANGNQSHLQLQHQQKQQHGSTMIVSNKLTSNQNAQDPVSRALNLPQTQPTDQTNASSALQNADHIERMKRIELLLSATSDQPLTQALLSQIRNAKEDGSKKLGKREQKKALKAAQAANGAPIKRPHVAAGFANQKPPPKLPQAIAEAALKKQQAKKKRASAARAKNANSKGKKETAAVSVRESSDSPIPASPASITNVGVAPDAYASSLQIPHEPFQNFSQHPSQTGFQMSSTFAQDTSSAAQVMYLPHESDQPMFSQGATFHPLSVSNVSSLSMTVPSSASYSSMFMPATSSTCSSSPSSPVSPNQEAVDVRNTPDCDTDGEQTFAMQPMISTNLQGFEGSEGVFTGSLPTPTQQGHFQFPQPSSQQAQQQQKQGLSMAQGNFQLLQQLQQQNTKESPAYAAPSFELLDHNMQMGAVSTPETFSGFSQTQHNSMTESLEALMMPSTQVPMVTSLGFQSQGHAQLQLLQQQQQPSFAATFDQASTMVQPQQQPQQQQHRHRQRASVSLSQPQLSRAIWLPSSPESISISHDTTAMPWSPVSEKNTMFQDSQQQQQQLRRQSMMASLQKSHNQPHPLYHHHQHQQSFYIPEMKDDDNFDPSYDDKSLSSSSPADGTATVAAGSTPIMSVLAD